MKKIAAAVLAALLLAGLVAVPAAAGTTLTFDKYRELAATANFVTWYYYVEDTSWQNWLIMYMKENAPQYVCYTDAALTEAQAVMAPADVFERYFYELYSFAHIDYCYTPWVAPNGFFADVIAPYLQHYRGQRKPWWNAAGEPVQLSEGYDAENGTYMISFMEADGEDYYEDTGYVDNGGGTYSFYYVAYDWDDAAEAYVAQDYGVVVTLKAEAHGSTLVSHARADRLPEKYDEVPTESVVYDVPESVTFEENIAFTPGTTVAVKVEESGAAVRAAEKALQDVAQKMVVFDFTATKGGEAVQPSGAVTVTFRIPAALSTDNLKLFYIPAQGAGQEIAMTVNKAERTGTAALEHFSTYALANVAAPTTKPTAAPTTKPTAAPTDPTAAPTDPTNAPTDPTAAPTDPTAAPADPTDAPADPTAVPTDPTKAPTDPTQDGASNFPLWPVIGGAAAVIVAAGAGIFFWQKKKRA